VKLEAECRRDGGRRDIPLSRILPRVLDEMQLDPKTRAGVEFFIDTSITQAYAADQKQLSLYNWDDDYTELFLALWIVPDGYIRIVEAMTKGLDIRLQHAVSEICRDENGVVVKTRGNGEFRASYGVVTVPHGVLAKGHIKFEPKLPAWKQEAINRIRTGLSDKFWFHFPRKFWKSNKAIVGRPDPDGKWSLWVNFEKYHREPVLLCFNRTGYAAKLEKMSDDKVVDAAMHFLRKEYGRRTPEPIAMQRSKWGLNEFSEGTLTHLPPGASSEDHRTRTPRRPSTLRRRLDLPRVQPPGRRRVMVGSAGGGESGDGPAVSRCGQTDFQAGESCGAFAITVNSNFRRRNQRS